MSTIPRGMLEAEYFQSAQVYLASLPPEHFMEATPQATQREITVQSFAGLKVRRPDVHYFNELLVQYPHGKKGKTGQVVPDNMVVLHDGPIEAVGSYDLPLQPAGPFLVLEYVSKSSKRKDYGKSFRKCESELKVPYYLVFYPETEDLTLFRQGAEKYVTVKPNDSGRVAIPELDLEAAIQDGWVRYWYRGALLRLTPDLERALDKMAEELRQSREETRQANEKARLADEKARLAQEETERLRAMLRAAGIDPNV